MTLETVLWELEQSIPTLNGDEAEELAKQLLALVYQARQHRVSIWLEEANSQKIHAI